MLIGAWGPRGAALAGELADEIKVGGTASAAVIRIVADRVAAGCRAAGRPADAVGVVAGAVTVVDEDGQAARRLARTEVAKYIAVVAGLDPAGGLPADLIGQIQQLLACGADEAAGDLIADDVLDRYAFAGAPEHVARLACAVLDAGAARVDFGTPHGLSDTSGVHLLGTRVLPLLRRHITCNGRGA
jgi:5,10-methylenetetrahydromethanopterin reductase